MDEIGGLPGELLDRLVELVNCDAVGDKQWYDLGYFAAFFIGGKALDGVVPDTGEAPLPGSVGEVERQRRELVSRAAYFELMRDRLGELVASGLDEPFLVRAVRDELRRQLEDLADVGTGDRNRAEMRGHIEATAEDPARIAAFRALLAETDPAAEALTDDEVSEKLRSMAQRSFLDPTSPDGALGRWAALNHWDEHAAALLPDAVFEQWRMRMVGRLR